MTRARKILNELEKSDRERPRAALIDDLPLFSAVRPEPQVEPPPQSAPPPDALREALATIDPDGLTPREALEALYRLKGMSLA